MKSWDISNLRGLGEEGELAERKLQERQEETRREISRKPGKEGISNKG